MTRPKPEQVNDHAETSNNSIGSKPPSQNGTFLGRANTNTPSEKEKPVTVVQSGVEKRELYLNRELSWLKFNERVLNEANDLRTPLLERVKFLAIANSNLDEFYMKRIGGLKQQVGAGVNKLTVDGRTPRQQLDECAFEVGRFLKNLSIAYAAIRDELSKAGVAVEKYSALNRRQQYLLSQYFKEEILPLITPLAINSTHPFPLISNLSLNLLVTFSKTENDTPLLARIKIPGPNEVPRFIQIGADNRFVMIEDVIVNNLELMFPGLEMQSYCLFRATRNAISEMDTTGANDLLEVIEDELRNRKFAPVVRLQTDSSISQENLLMLADKLGLNNAEDIFICDDMIGMCDVMELAGLDIPALRDRPHHPVDNSMLRSDQDVFASIREAGSILLLHPYESFETSIARMVREASIDPKVFAIKMTLYRTSADTRIIEYLINAAQNGKQVAVVVELQARFDEAANIKWANHLVEAGIHVNYGVLGLKTHCKTLLVVRQEKGRLRRYAHFGTGNYHAGTARLYSDVGLLTCEEDLVNDLSELFNYLTTRWSNAREYSQLLVAPLAIKNGLLTRIDREIDRHSASSPGLIRLKTNALEDTDITAALYRASQAGVKVELLVRDICRLRPGLPGLSENITVISVIGRFLEHARIYYFRNGGDEEFYIGSADLMKRNLERRVEVLVPVRDTAARNLLLEMLVGQQIDRRSVWDMDGDGNYTQRLPLKGKSSLPGCQENAIRATIERNTRLVAAREKEHFHQLQTPNSGISNRRGG